MKEKLQYGENPTSHDLDDILDEALAQYATAEPRAGLEERILANLRPEDTQPYRAWWQWSFAAMAAMVLIIVAALAWGWSRPSSPPIVNRRPTAIQPEAQKKVLAQQDPAERPHPKVRPRVVPSSTEQSVAVGVPKLGQFPSPQPLSEEEMALARYVWNFPGDAQLVAQAQEASSKEILRKMEAQANESAESN